MGLLKETMQAIISIDETISNFCIFWRFEIMKKDINRKNAVKELPEERTVDRRFAYPEHLSFDQRISAVQLFAGLKDDEFGAKVGLTCGQIYDLRRGKTEPWPALHRAISRRYNIDEQWLATGHLPQTAEEPAKPLATSKVTPLSGYGEPAGNMCQTDPTLQRLRGTYYRQETDPNFAQEYVDQKNDGREAHRTQG